MSKYRPDNRIILHHIATESMAPYQSHFPLVEIFCYFSLWFITISLFYHKFSFVLYFCIKRSIFLSMYALCIDLWFFVATVQFDVASGLIIFLISRRNKWRIISILPFEFNVILYIINSAAVLLLSYKIQ